MANFGGLGHADFANMGGFETSPAMGNKSNAGAINKKSTLRALTIKQLAQAYSNPNIDIAVCDGQDIDDVTVVGKCIAYNRFQPIDEYVVDDATGKLHVRFFTDPEPTEALQQLRASCAPGNYIRVEGTMRNTDGQLFMQAYSIKPVTDHNEVTYHLLNCIFQHLNFAKTGTSAPSMAPPNQGMVGMGGGFNPCQQAVLEVTRSPEFVNAEAGVPVQDILARLGTRFAQGQVQEAVRFLVSEGHLYTTVDDNHVKLS